MESTQKEIALHNAANRYPIDDAGINVALNDLRFFRSSMFEVDRSRILDDRSFEKNNPAHPLAAKNRFTRQNAAQFFLLLSQGAPELITNEILEELHISLFDCDAAIRFDIAQALGILSRPESSSFLLRLIEKEDESKMVKQIAEEVFASIGSTIGQKELHSNEESITIRHTDESRHKSSLRNVSKITRPIKVSIHDEFYILLSALSYEAKNNIITKTGEKNLELLRSQDFSYSISGDKETYSLDLHKKRAFILDHYCPNVTRINSIG